MIPSTDARYASLIAFAQSRAMGGATNGGGGVLAGSSPGGSDCGRNSDGKFGEGNKCAVVGGVLKPATAQLHDGQPEFGDSDDEYVYHVTTTAKAQSILTSGFKDSKATVKGWYEGYSKGKVFFTEKSGLATWQSKIENHLFHSHDDPPSTSIVKVKKSEVSHLLEPDDVGSKDAGAAAYFVDLSQKKKSSRAFCPTGEGGGVDNSCGAGQPSAATTSHSMPKSRVDDPRNATSWLSPSGDFHPVDRSDSEHGWATHHEWAWKHGVDGGEPELMSKGWMRVVRMGNSIYASSDSGKQMTAKQVKSLTDHAIHNGYDEAIYEPYAGRHTTVWQKGNRSARAFCPTGEGGGVDNSCGGDYQGLHRAPSQDQGSPAHALEGTFPPDVYSHDAGRLYGHGDPSLDEKSADAIRRLQGRPNRMVRIYRAVPVSESTSSHIASLEKQMAKILKYGPKGTGSYDKLQEELEKVKKAPRKEAKINPGDWVTLNRDYAKQHGESTLGGKYKIISKVVTAKEIHNDGNSIHEWGYNPEKKKRSLDAAQSRDCGRDKDGKFGDGNKCQTVYHGTDADGPEGLDFKEVTQSKTSWQLGDWDVTRHGVFFSDSKSFASEFGKNVGEFDLKAKKVADLTPLPGNWHSQIVDEFVDSLDALGPDRDVWIAAKYSNPSKPWLLFDDAVGAKFVPWLKSKGYDAAKFPESTDTGTYGTTFAVLDKKKVSPKKRSLDARHASLLAFAQARDCGRGEDGKFSTGNTCASGIAADAAKGAASGGIKGAIAGLISGGPGAVKPGAAIGATIGAVKGIYDNQMRPTRVKRMIEKVGSTDDKVAKLIKDLGGTPKSSADVRGGALRLTVRDSKNNKVFSVEINQKRVTVYPRRATGTLTDREIARVKGIAKDVSPKDVAIVVKKTSSAYVGKLLKNGFKAAVGHAADVLLFSYAAPIGDAVVHEVTHVLKKKK